MMKSILTFILVLIITSCVNSVNKESEKLKNDSLEMISMKNQKYNDSIKLVTDSINNIKIKEEHINRIKNSIKVTSVYLSEPNSASGRDVYFYFRNLSDSTIKYLTFQASFYNNVDDIVTCEIKDDIITGFQVTGPIKSRQSDGGCFPCIIYNYSVTKIKLYIIEIEYMNGEKLKIEGNDLKLVGLKDNKIEHL